MAANPGTPVASRAARIRLSAVQGPGSVRTGTEARFLRLRVQAPRGEEHLAQPSGDEPGPMRSDAPGSLRVAQRTWGGKEDCLWICPRRGGVAAAWR
jgi:hypothetical protein